MKHKMNPNHYYLPQIESMIERNPAIDFYQKDSLYELFCFIRDKFFPNEPWNVLVIMEKFTKHIDDFYESRI